VTGEEFLEFVAAHRWHTAKSSPHQYSIKHWSPDRAWFLRAVRFADEQGGPGKWNGETFYYYRTGDGYRYWSYRKRGEGCELEEVVCFNRARESGQLRLPLYGVYPSPEG
jgi:hypothetical protein